MSSGKGLHESLLAVANDLLKANRKRPKEAHLRRAISSVYYALFHYLAKLCADSFIGTQGARGRSKSAWQQVYRSLEHGAARNACEAAKSKNFPSEIKDFAALFVEYQKKRHDADYDPYANSGFRKEDVSDIIKQAELAIEAVKNMPHNDLRAFSAFLLLKPPRR